MTNGYVVLKELPSLYMGNPALTIGKEYKINYVDGSCYCIDDDNGDSCTIGKCRFYQGIDLV